MARDTNQNENKVETKRIARPRNTNKNDKQNKKIIDNNKQNKENPNNIKFEFNVTQKNRYLDALGIDASCYGTNFTFIGDEREEEWEKEREDFGFDGRETWELNNTFIQWLYSHLKMFMAKAEDTVDLTFRTFDFEGVVYTQQDAIKYIINACEKYLVALYKFEYNVEEEKIIEETQKALRLWAMIFPTMWW